MDEVNEAVEVNGWTLTRHAPPPLSGSARFKAAEALSRFAEAEKYHAAAMLHDEAQHAVDPRLEALANRPGMQISLRTGRILSYAATDSAAMEIALLAGLSQGQGHRLLDQAETLVMDTPEVLQSLALGRIGVAHVQRILEHTQHIVAEPVALPAKGADEATKEEFERAVATGAARARADRRDFGVDMLAIAPGKSPTQLRTRGRQVLEKYYGFSFTKRSRTELRQRRISMEEARDGMSWFSGYLPTASCQAIFSKIDAMARLLKADPASAAAVSDAAARAGGFGSAGEPGLGNPESEYPTANEGIPGALPGPIAGTNADAGVGVGVVGDDPGQFRSLDQLRADVFTDMMLNGPRGQGLEHVDAQVFVAIPATMLPGTPGGPTRTDGTPSDGTETVGNYGDCGTSTGTSTSTGTGTGTENAEGFSSDAGPSESPKTSIGDDDGPGSHTAGKAGEVSTIGAGPVGVDDPGGVARAELMPGSAVPTILGGGVIDQQSAARLMVAAKTWWRVITDPVTGAVVEFGQNRYRPTAAQRAILQFRDGTCTTPGCTAPGRTCEIDHTREWQDGGGTDIANLRLGCKRCHRLKSLGLLEVRQCAGGTMVVTSLFGTRRVGYPAASLALADPWQSGASVGDGGSGDGAQAPPEDSDAVVPLVDPPDEVAPRRFTIESSRIERDFEAYQGLQSSQWGRVQDVPDSSSESPEYGRYARSRYGRAARKRRLRRAAGEYGPPMIPRPDDRDNPRRPEPEEPDEPPPDPPF